MTSDWLGIDYVQGVGFEGDSITDAGLVHLKGLHLRQGLSLESDQITDAGLVHLRSLKDLETLTLNCERRRRV